MAEGKYVVGYEYTNKQGLNAKVVEYRGRKDITVEFEDGCRKKTTGSYIKNGFPLHPTFGKVKVGDTFPCKSGDYVTVVEVLKSGMVKIKWASNGEEATRALSHVKDGINKNPKYKEVCVGDKIVCHSGETVTVVQAGAYHDIVVEYEDGFQLKTDRGCCRSGRIRRLWADDKIGYKFTTNSGWVGEIVEYNNAFDVLVKWQDGSMSRETTANIQSGSIKPLNQPIKYGLGYFGIGRFVPNSYATGNKVDEKIYDFWGRMFTRCYNPRELNKDRTATYRDAFVDEYFYNLQNFAEWALQEGNWMHHGMELEKDLFGDGKLYSPNNCCFLPGNINKFLMETKLSWGSYPVGVNVIMPKPGTNATIGYVARCNNGNKREYLGFFKTPKQAFFAYKKRKEEVAKELVIAYKDLLTPRIIDKLNTFTVNIPEGVSLDNY